MQENNVNVVMSEPIYITIDSGIDGITPYVGENGNWYEGCVDTGIHAAGATGAVFTPSVADNSELSWTNNGGLENPPTKNIRGLQGFFFTPSVDVNGNITWTNNGDIANPLAQNIKGETGDPFVIAKVYDTVAKMNADYSGSEVKVGQFVMVNTGNIEDEDTGKLYVKGNTQYDFIVDISGMQGFAGKTPILEAGTTTTGASADVSVTPNGLDSNGNPKYLINFVIPTAEIDAATTAANTAATLATEVANNPTKVGDDNYIYKYDPGTKEYAKTDILVKGDAGFAATIEVGTVTSVGPSQPATVINTGTSSAAIFDFEIPKGVDGYNNVLILPWVEPIFDTEPNLPTNQQAFIDAWGPAIEKYDVDSAKYHVIMNIMVDITPLQLDCQLMPRLDISGNKVGYSINAIAIVPTEIELGKMIGLRQYQSVNVLMSDGKMTAVDVYRSSPAIDMSTGTPNYLLDSAASAPLDQLTATDRLLGFNAVGNPVTATALQVSDYVQGQVPYVGENLLLESSGPYARQDSGTIKALSFSSGFLEQGRTYVFSYVDECTSPAYPTFDLLTSNGPDPIQRIEPGVPFIATRTDWEHVLISRMNEGGIYSVSRLKLEQGTKVTPWFPATADMAIKPDYTSLEEQLVPGEFWLGADGVKGQAYCRTFVLTGQVTAGSFSLFQRIAIGARSIVSVVGCTEGTSAIDGIARIEPYTSVILYKTGDLSGVIDLVKNFGTELAVGSLATMTANVKYTK